MKVTPRTKRVQAVSHIALCPWACNCTGDGIYLQLGLRRWLPLAWDPGGSGMCDQRSQATCGSRQFVENKLIMGRVTSEGQRAAACLMHVQTRRDKSRQLHNTHAQLCLYLHYQWQVYGIILLVYQHKGQRSATGSDLLLVQTYSPRYS
jgi:hypothetical protein